MFPENEEMKNLITEIPLLITQKENLLVELDKNIVISEEDLENFDQTIHIIMQLEKSLAQLV